MDCYRVSPLVDHARNNSPECLTPAGGDFIPETASTLFPPTLPDYQGRLL